jgi:hypothetical protein
MKKIVLAGLFAISLIALSQQQASAWTNHRFSVGLSWSRQAGGNSLGWGAWVNGQPPGPEAFGGGDYGVPSFGGHHGGHHGGHGSAPQYYAPMPQASPTTSYQVAPMQSPYAGNYYYSSPFQFASYPQQTFYYYYPSTYYYGQ